VTLLYAASGAGKTSLLNAGLIPVLERDERFEILPSARLGRLQVELFASSGFRNVFVFSTIQSWGEGVPESGRGGESNETTSSTRKRGPSPDVVRDSEASTDIPLADFLAARPRLRDRRGRPLPRLLIFDQFEELFSSYPEFWEHREGFFEQVADALDRDPRLRLVPIVREDYLANLDPYLHILPEPVRFRLERLGPEAALAAVTGPLHESGRSFADGVAERLVDNLLALRVDIGTHEPLEVRGEFVEPVHLQLVCHSLWADLPPDVVEISEEHLRDFGDVDQVLTRFYEDAIKAAVVTTRIKEKRLRNWTDVELITSVGTRGTVYRSAESTAGIANEVVDALESARLIRTERRAGARWYELTHDRLIEPVRNSNRRFEEIRVRARRHRTTVAAAVLAVSIGAVLLPSMGWLGAPPLGDSRVIQQEAESSRALLSVLRGHRGSVRDAAYGPDGRRIVTAGSDGTTRIWDAQTGQALGVLQAPDGSLSSAQFSPDGRRIVTAGSDGKARIWDAQTGQALDVLKAPDGSLSSAQFSPDGRQIVTAGSDGTARIWDAQTGQALGVLQAPDGSLSSAQFSPDGRQIVTAGSDGDVWIWDVETGEEITRFRGSLDGGLSSAAFSPGGDKVVTAGLDGTAGIWDVETRNASGVILRLSEESLTSAAFGPDGRLVVTAGLDGTARILQAPKWKARQVLRVPGASLFSAAFSPRGNKVVTAGSDGTARIWLAVPPPPAANPSVFLSRDSGPVGTSVQVSGEGFASGERVVISFHTEQIGSTNADDEGTFSNVTVTIPESFSVFAPQQFFVIARGQSSLQTATAPFTIIGTVE
jgi:WD40 repeat protein